MISVTLCAAAHDYKFITHNNMYVRNIKAKNYFNDNQLKRTLYSGLVSANIKTNTQT